MHKGLPALHLGAPADLFDTRRLVSGGQRGGVGCRRSFSGCRQGAFCYRRAVARYSAHKLSLPSTKSWFLCAFGVWCPRFQAFRAQNRGFCAREEVKVASGSVKWPSCKSPRTLSKCKYLITKQLTFGAVLGEHKLSSPSTRLKVNHLCIRCLCFESVRGDLHEGHFTLPDATFTSSRAQKPRLCHRNA